MTKKEKLAFYDGVIWAAFWLVQAHYPTLAAEMCQEAGIDKIRLENCEPYDKPAVREILKVWD